MSFDINEIKKIKVSLLGGKSTLNNEEEYSELLATSVKAIQAFTKEKSNFNDKTFIKEILELFNVIQDSGFANDFISLYDENDYFLLGETLKKNLLNEYTDTDKFIKNIVYTYLNIFRNKSHLVRIAEHKKWTNLLSSLIDLSNFNTRKLFKQRKNQYSTKTLFNTLVGENVTSLNWEDIDNEINKFSKSMINLLENRSDKPRVAFLTENSLTMALLDLACLNNGIVNVMIPANSVPQHISFILNQTKCDFVIISNEKQLAKLKSVKKELTYLKKGVLIDGTSAEDWIISFADFLDLSNNEEINQEEIDLDINSPATLMYTSGTTGEPKGIIFTQKNIIFKRFCRAIALPEISDQDSFLSYLPLYHTFGRWLELMGTIFWGGTYSFMENPSAETMMTNMQMVKPTIFISIPKKWTQLYDYVVSKVDIEIDEEEVIFNEVQNVTGGKLKWGLSAAGYLSPDVFKFFQKNNVNLMSGFGMTEATGGITMTPPEKYITNSLGKALPGIEIKLADDGELLVRGDYVMPGYYGQSVEETFTEDEWFPTGDIMKIDSHGFIEIIDRKKEIYKNVKGETIAPQRIENLFREFETIKQVFVVGDHRPFNTVLIYPDYDSEILDNLFDDQKGEYFSNLVVTINKFLAPFERIVDFRIIERPFNLEKGELTPKNTYKRRVIEENFSLLIEELYKKDYYSLFLGNTEIKIPNWFLRERGCLTGDIKINSTELEIPKLNKSLTLKKIDKGLFRIGDYIYQIKSPNIDLHEFLINPIYWLGNQELLLFTDEAILQWYRQTTEEEAIKLNGHYPNKKSTEKTKQLLSKINDAGEKSLYGLHLALVLIRSINLEDGLLGIQYIEKLFKDEMQEIYKVAFYFLDKPIISANKEVQKKLFFLAISQTDKNQLKNIFEKYLKIGPEIFDDEIKNKIVNNKICLESIDILDEILNEKIQLRYQSKNIENSVIPVLLDILSRFGIQHPTKYAEIRRKLVSVQLIHEWSELSVLAQKYRTIMRKGFRKWLGTNETVAVDIETSDEYGWDDVIIFDDELNGAEKELLTNAISTTLILREALFLFTKGRVIRLSNILPRGIWISRHLQNETEIVYRVSIQTRHQGSFDILLNHNFNKEEAKILEEVNWLILAGSRFFVTELVEDFGGYWNENKLGSQKYQPGLTVSHLFNREVKKNPNFAEEKFYNLWPFFIWNAAAAYINFWRLTSGRMQIDNPTPDNLIIPSHDYQKGTRFVSLSNRATFQSFSDLFFNFYEKFVIPIEKKYPFVKRESAWKYIFPGLINAEGENEGLEILNYFLIEIKKSEIEYKEEIVTQLEKLLNNVKENGYIPKQLYFAIKRFLRWNYLNINASISAQAQMLNELYDAYNLVDLEKFYPETRTRFYLETVFKNSEPEFVRVVKGICQLQHENKINKEEFLNEISSVQNEFELNKKETFFIARLSYPHLKPFDSASFVQLEVDGDHAANLVVKVEDHDGDPFYIRKPITPKEISKLYQLFLDANLQVSFKPEHNFMVAISERGLIIGGLFYSHSNKEVVHMEKIVVSNRCRRQGVSEAIMNEFFSRMKDEGFLFVTTGYFRPEYFYRFDFKIEKKYSGLVKKL